MNLLTTPEEEAIIQANFSNQYSEITSKINLLVSFIRDFKKCGNCEFLDMESTDRFKRCSIEGLRDAESIACSKWELSE